jgi:translation initiation factor 4G
MLYRKVRGILNKLTPEKFDTLVCQVKELRVSQLNVLMRIIDMVFEKVRRFS